MDKELAEVIKKFSNLHNSKQDYTSNEAKKLVEELQKYLNTKFPCDIEALSNFADMYRQSDFKYNIDTMSSIGTAEFIANAIEDYCYN